MEQTPEYVLGPGDQVLVHVSDMEDIPQTPIRIDPNGRMDLPLVGSVQAGGLTVFQLHDELSRRLGRYLKAPDITINVAGMESRPVSVVGEVVNPGVHQLTGPTRLLDVVSLSGGLKPDAGPNILVTREARWGQLQGPEVATDPATGATTETFPADALLKLKTPDSNILLRPGDVVSVPKGELVYVVGDVKKAGGFVLSTHRTMSVLEALTLAEGLGPDSAAGDARILRPNPNGEGDHTLIPVNVSKMLAGKMPDVKLYADDILFVPHSGFKVGSRRAVEAAIGITTGVLVYR
ncbi:MAG: polysaccharide biosynthesis/export family protein [Rhodospirillales bacterium]|nr:polysaccharide biosynthesis/export family protein [Acetobacter sp.]